METKTHDFADLADHDIKDHEKIDDVEESESTEDNESVKESNIDLNRKSKKNKIRNVRKTNRLHTTIGEAVCYRTNLKFNGKKKIFTLKN
jgi:hypothetical protein